MPFFPSIPVPDQTTHRPHPLMAKPALRRTVGTARVLPALSGLTLLLVEDSRFAADPVRLFCQRAGGRLRRAETVAAASVHLRTYRPDAVIVDLGLPDGRGEDLIRMIAGVRDRPLILGTSADALAEQDALSAGADAFLAKPLRDFGALVRALHPIFPDRQGQGPADISVPGPVDPLALLDDLAYAAEQMHMAQGPTQRSYLAKFLAGVATAAGDQQLLLAARAVSTQDRGWTRLHSLVAQRAAIRPTV